MKIETVPSYRIAYVRLTGPYGPDNVQAMDKQKAWGNIFTMLSNHGLHLDGHPIVERYLEELLSQHECEICIPIQ